MICVGCGVKIEEKTKACPSCGRSDPASLRFGALKITPSFFGFILFIVAAYFLVGFFI